MPDGTATATPGPVWESFAAWCRRGPYAAFVAEARLPADTPVQLLRLQQPAISKADPPTNEFSVQFVLRGSPSTQIDLGANRFEHDGRSGDFVLAPPGVACEYVLGGPSELLFLTLPRAPVNAVLSEASHGRLRDHGPMHAAMHRDPMVESLLRRLWAEAVDGNPMGPLYAEDAATAVAARLARMALRASGMPDMVEDTPPLHGARLARVLARIEDELEADLRQAELAETAGLSAWHFARAFKSATGVAPHRFVVLRRLARAQWMLRTTKLGLAEIAAASGFSSHAHLTTLFRREVGAPPSNWRGQSRAP